MSRIGFGAAAALLVLSVGTGHANETGEVRASTGINAVVGVEPLAVSYPHRDCVGPGLPGTAAPHVTHTERVSGFMIGGGVVRFGASTLAPLGAGICPTALSGSVLKDDFTGTWRMTAVCRGSLNDGATFLDWEIDAVAGIVQGQGSDGTGCVGYAYTSFSLDVTIAISGTAFLGVPLDALGGISFTITQ